MTIQRWLPSTTADYYVGHELGPVKLNPFVIKMTFKYHDITQVNRGSRS
jgi:hypothetical protein